MPALRESPLETTSANLTRPRVWAYPQVRSHALAALTADTLYLVSPAESADPTWQQELDQGREVESVLGDRAERFELAAIRKAKHDLVANSLVLDVEYARGGTRRVVIEFEDHASADACFTKLWRRLGRKVRLLPCKKDFWALAKVPAFVLIAVLAATLVLAIAANGVEHVAEARNAGVPTSSLSSTLEAVLGGVPWEVICGVGGALAAVVQVWLYRRVTEPPQKLEIVRV